MKVNKMLSLDLEIIQRLQQERNASEIVNNLLKEFYEEAKVEDAEK